MQPDTPCSEASLDVEEDVLGTGANGTVHWIGLEVRGAWRPKAVVDNDLPDLTAAWLRALKGRPDTRPVLVKRRGKRERTTVWYANVIEGRVHRFELDGPEAAPALPWDELFRGETEVGLTDERPIFVCTHSARDHCCGLHGAGVSRALEKAAPGRVWQCTHLGGHRFAATLVALPDGLHYGRVRAAEAPILVEALDDGRIYDLHRLRGQVRYPQAVQAAVDTVRRERSLTRVDEIAVHGWTIDGPRTEVHLRALGEDLRRAVERVVREGVEVPGSCHGTPGPVKAWRVTDAPVAAD